MRSGAPFYGTAATGGNMGLYEDGPIPLGFFSSQCQP